MKKPNRWLRRLLMGLGILVGLLVLALGGLYFYTDYAMRGTDLPVVTVLPKGDAVAGERLARIQGCTGCHGAQLQGTVLAEIPNVVRLIAPNLTQARGRYDQRAFLRLMRAGTKADGRMALVMPNKAHQRLTDQQLADLEAFMRSVPVVQNTLRPTRLYPLARVGIVAGEYDVAAMRADTPESPAVLADRNQSNRMRHFVQTTCGECHGIDMKGDPKEAVPPLLIARAYSDEQFLRLMHDGKTLAGTDSATGMMSEVARDRFSRLSAQEVAELKEFLSQETP